MIEKADWLIKHLVDAETTDRATRSMGYQMGAARFPIHRSFADFDFSQSKVERRLIDDLASLTFTDTALNVVLVDGTGTGKTHLATSLCVSAIQQHGKRVRFYSTVDLVNTLELEKAAGKQGRLATNMLQMDLVTLDELGYLPFSQAGGALIKVMGLPGSWRPCSLPPVSPPVSIRCAGSDCCSHRSESTSSP